MKTTKAFYLKNKKIGKTNAILFFLTYNYGIIHSYFKGFTSSNKLYPLMDIGHELEITFLIKDENFYIEKAKLIKSYDLKDYNHLVIISFIFDLISNIPSRLEISFENFYEFTNAILNAILISNWKFNLLILYELKILELLGILSDHMKCSNCGVIFSEKEISFSSKDSWSFYCGKCQDLHLNSLTLTNQERTILQYLKNINYPFTIKHGLTPKSALKIQKHFNNLLADGFYLNSLKSLMDIFEKNIVSE